MKQMHPNPRKFQWVSCLLLLVATFLAFSKPILAAETMLNTAQIGEMHQLFENESQALIRSNTTTSGHTMICCLEGEESFSLANQVSLKVVKDSSVSAQGEHTLCENTTIFSLGENTLPSGEITLLSSCQRE